jgi:hypothetical protein
MGWDLGFGIGMGLGSGIGMGMGFGIWDGMGWDSHPIYLGGKYSYSQDKMISIKKSSGTRFCKHMICYIWRKLFCYMAQFLAPTINFFFAFVFIIQMYILNLQNCF